jgi:hypothetical protein
MKNYSIVRVGNEYVVQADDKSVLKIASRRRAAKLITDATELMEQRPAASVGDVSSISCDLGAISDPEIISDAGIVPDSSEVS